MEALQLEQLNKSVTILTNEVTDLKKLITEKKEKPPHDYPERLFTIKEAAQFLSVAVSTLHNKTSKGKIPFKKRNGRLYFSRTELLEYLNAGHKKTNADIEREEQLSKTKK